MPNDHFSHYKSPNIVIVPNVSSCPIPLKIRKMENNIQVPLVDNIYEDTPKSQAKASQASLDHNKKREIIKRPATQVTWLSDYLKNSGKAPTPSIWQHKIPRLYVPHKCDLVEDFQIPTPGFPLKKMNIVTEKTIKINESATIQNTKDNLEPKRKFLKTRKQINNKKESAIKTTKQCSKLNTQKKLKLKTQNAILNKYKCKICNTIRTKFMNNSNTCDKCKCKMIVNPNPTPIPSLLKKITPLNNEIKVKIKATPKTKNDKIEIVLNKEEDTENSLIKNVPYKRNEIVKNIIKPSTSDNIHQNGKKNQSQMEKISNKNSKNITEAEKKCDINDFSKIKSLKTTNNDNNLIKTEHIDNSTLQTHSNTSNSKPIQIKHHKISKAIKKYTAERTSRKKIRLTINLICNNKEENIKRNENTTASNVDLDFLNDFNVDEIVESLNICDDISKQTIENTIIKNDVVDTIDSLRTLKKEDEALTTSKFIDNTNYLISHYGHTDIIVQENNKKTVKETKEAYSNKELLSDDKKTEEKTTKASSKELSAFENKNIITTEILKCFHGKKQKRDDHVSVKDLTEHENSIKRDKDNIYNDDQTSLFVETILNNRITGNDSNHQKNKQYTIITEESNNQSRNKEDCLNNDRQINIAPEIGHTVSEISGDQKQNGKPQKEIDGNKRERKQSDHTVNDVEQLRTNVEQSDIKGQNINFSQIDSLHEKSLNENKNILCFSSTNSEHENKEKTINLNENHESKNISENLICHKNSGNLVIQSNIVKSNKYINTSISKNGQRLKLASDEILIKQLEKRMFTYFHSEFSLTRIIEKGRFTKVFQCEDAVGKKYALKMIKDERHIAFKRTNLWLTVQANIPKDNLMIVNLVNDFGFNQNWCFLMEYYPINLQQALNERQRPFYIDHIQDLTRQLVGAVMLLRHKNIIHLAISPTHILLSGCRRQLRLCRLESAWHIQNIKVLPTTGTINYRTPEAILGFPAGFGIDVWSTALVLFEMATNIVLFPGYNNNQILFNQMCTLGSFPHEMILNSRYRSNHFRGLLFKRKMGKNENPCVINNFVQNNRLYGTVNWAYAKHWRFERDGIQQQRDRIKLDCFVALLKGMLNVHPRYRLSIEDVYGHPFLYG